MKFSSCSSSAFLLLVLILVSITVYSEGWKQLRPNNTPAGQLNWEKFVWFSSNSACLNDNRIHMHIQNPGEKIYYGFNYQISGYIYPMFVRILDDKGNLKHTDSIRYQNSPGWIFDYTQASAGPIVVNPAGYEGFSWTPPGTGDYMMDMGSYNPTFGGLFFNMDITVVDTTAIPYRAIDGRVYCKSWNIDCYGNGGFIGKLYSLPGDSIVTSIYYNGLGGTYFMMCMNRNGIYPPPVSWTTARRSVPIFPIWYNYKEIKLFLNDPDSLSYPSGVLGQIYPGTLTVTPDCNGSVAISFQSNKSGLAEIQIKLDPSPNPQPIDTLIKDSVHNGLNTIMWNGINGLGQAVANGTLFQVIVTFMNGLTNHPMNITSGMSPGFIVNLQRPTGPTPLMFWDDQLIDTSKYNFQGCLSSMPSTGCHPITGSPYGINNVINTWWYTSTGKLMSPQILFKRSFHSITDTTVCPRDTVIWRGQLYLIPGTYVQNYSSVLTGCDSTYTLHFYNLPAPVVNLGHDTTACTGQTVTFNAGYCAGCTYQWANLTLGQMNIGTSQTYTASQSGLYMATVTGPNGCKEMDTVSLTIGLPMPVSIAISPSVNPSCTGTSVNFSSNSVNPGTSPSYQWKVNGANAGTNSSTFSYIPANGDTICCLLTSSITSCISTNPATSNTVIMTVNLPLTVGISISASANPVCAGTLVTFTASPVNPGSSPVYQWKVNGITVGTNAATYTYMPVNGDVVSCNLTSSLLSCVSGNPASSNPLTMVISPQLPVSISIAASVNPLCSGSPAHFTATPTNAGATPVFQWKVNGLNSGTNSSAFSYLPSNGDIVNCELLSSLSCAFNNPALSNPISVSVKPLPYISFSSCYDTITIITAKAFRLKGGVPPGGTYTGPGVDTVTSMFSPSAAGSGLKTITYAYRNQSSCMNMKTHTINVLIVSFAGCGSVLTDVRDGRTYPTVMLGTQCWMEKNLNYGAATPGITNQTDNCQVEKYCYNDIALNCSSFGGLYQWDELMQYQAAPGSQGICPPGWHVPTQSEWMTLFTFYQEQALAGKPLQDTIIVGFRAKESGVIYSNFSWSLKGFASIFWTSTPSGTIKAVSHGMNLINFSVSDYHANRSNAFGVRCLRD